MNEIFIHIVVIFILLETHKITAKKFTSKILQIWKDIHYPFCDMIQIIRI